MVGGAAVVRPLPRPRALPWQTLVDRRGWTLVFLVLFAVLLALVGLPFAGLVLSSFSVSGLPSRFSFTLANYAAVLGDARNYGLLGTSLVFSAASVALGLAIGAPLAWFVERTRVPGKNLIRAVILAQVAIPPVLVAMSWTLLASPKIGLLNDPIRAVFGAGAVFNIYSLPGMVFVQALSFVPLVFVILSPALRNIDASHEEAALMSGAGPAAVLRFVSLPIVRPAFLVAALYGFVTGLLTFDIPATLGIPGNVFVFSSEIYFSVQRYPLPRYGEVSVLSLIALIIVALASVAYLRATAGAARFATISGRFRSRAIVLSARGRVFAYGWICLYLLAGLILPVLVMFWTSLLPFFGRLSGEQLALVTLDNFREAFASPSLGVALGNTLLNSGLAATIGTALAALIAWVVTRTPTPGRRVLDALAVLPLVIPGVVLGLSLLYAYLLITFIPLYGTLWILTVAHITAALPFATKSSGAAFAQVHPELEEAALVSGRSQVDVFRRITLPLVMPALLFIWVWTFVHSVRDLSTSVMLYSAKSPVIANLLWQLWDYGNLNTGAAVGTLLFLALLALAAVALTLLGRSRSAAGLL